MTGIEKNEFEQLAEVVNMPTRFECYETMEDIAKLAMLAYFAGSCDACGWINKESIKKEK
jgi:hypothetical protein